MSLIKLIKQQLGLSVTPANNFVLDASADDGTMKLARGNAGATTQDIMTVDAAGLVDFVGGLVNGTIKQGDLAADALGPSTVSSIGSMTFPNGLILKWGSGNSSAGSLTVTFATAFPTDIFQAFGICAVTANIVCVVQSQSASNAVFLSHVGSTGAGATTPIRWFAIGY